jgi:hypothetical protein
VTSVVAAFESGAGGWGWDVAEIPTKAVGTTDIAVGDGRFDKIYTGAVIYTGWGIFFGEWVRVHKIGF